MPVASQDSLLDELSRWKSQAIVLQRRNEELEEERRQRRRSGPPSGSPPLDAALAVLQGDPRSKGYLRQLVQERGMLAEVQGIVAAGVRFDAEFCERVLVPLYLPPREFDPWRAFPRRKSETEAFLSFEEHRWRAVAQIERNLGYELIAPVADLDPYDVGLHEDAPVHRLSVPEEAPELASRVARLLRPGFRTAQGVVLRARVKRYLERP